MQRVLYVHGANSTRNSFNHIVSCLPKHECSFFEYSTDTPALKNLNDLIAKLTVEDQSVDIVAHSLGGLLAVLCASTITNSQLVNKIVTISSPFGGCGSASLLSLWIRHQLLSDIMPNSELIRSIAKLPKRSDVTNILSIGGSTPFLRGPNDGVVTVASQEALYDCDKHRLYYNHSEILQAPETVKILKQSLFV